MKIYIIIQSAFDYSDYSEQPFKAFLNKESAQKLCDELNEKIKDYAIIKFVRDNDIDEFDDESVDKLYEQFPFLKELQPFFFEKNSVYEYEMLNNFVIKECELDLQGGFIGGIDLAGGSK